MNMPAGYYNRFNPADNFEKHLFRAGKVLQSAEVNEIQESVLHRVRGLADSLFHDGDVLRDCVVRVDQDTGAVTCSSGAVYLRGAVRGVPPGAFTIPTSGTLSIGIRLVETVVSELDDTNLLDPAANIRNYGQPGAHRLKLDPVWAWSGDAGAGDFFPMFTVDAAVMRPKQAPPQIDSLSRAIEKYDRDSAGGTYIVRGMGVKALADDLEGNQVYSIAEGSVHVRGRSIEYDAGRRFVVDAQPDLRFVDSEPHVSSGTAPQRVTLNEYPVANITEVKITKSSTATITHGAFVGSQDTLPHSSVLSITSIKQGATTYVQGTDYKLTAGKVDWSLPGAEPATGSTYEAVYQHIAAAVPTAIDNSGYTVADAVAGSTILTSYNQYLPRYDKICVDEDGGFIFLKGVPASWRPTVPDVPENLLSIATIFQTWDNARTVTNDGVQVVPMDEIAGLKFRLDNVVSLVAQSRLENSVAMRETGLVKGIFTDPFLDDSLRDAGTPQTGAIFGGVLTLPITAHMEEADNRGGAVSTLAHTNVNSRVQQLARTGSVLVNPYQAFEPMPVVATLNPAIDRWTETETEWASPVTEIINRGWWWLWWWRRRETTVISSSVSDIGSRTEPISNLRSIPVSFQLRFMKPGEEVATLTFDGLDVAFAAGPANADGTLSGTFTIPVGIPAGTKEVIFIGDQGSEGRATFTGQGFREITTKQLTTVQSVRRVDPVAQTFTMDAPAQVSGINLWFTALGPEPVEVQIRETTAGVPSQTIRASTRIATADLSADQWQQVLFDYPIPLEAGVEFAVVVMSNDAITAVAIAELGKVDQATNQWVTAQPYQVGVLLTSSNGSTWTASQTADLTFGLLTASFTETSRTINLGNVAVVGATDLLIRANVESPAADTTCRFALTMPDATVYYVASEQPLRLDAPVTGNVKVEAILDGSATASPILHRDVQLLWGVLGANGDYVSRAMTGGNNIRVKMTLEVDLPGAANVAVAFKGDTDPGWTALSSPTAVTLPDGWVELTWLSAVVSKPLVQGKVALTGNTQDRPEARNLRISTV